MPEWPNITPSAPPPPTPRTRATHISSQAPSSANDAPVSPTDRLQHAQLLREMGGVTRTRAGRAPVPNLRYFNSDNAAQRGRRLGYAELLAAALVGRDPATYAEAMCSAEVEE